MCSLSIAVSIATLLPGAPILTRYAESMNPFAKRKLIEPTVPEEKVANKLNNLTVPKLCVKLNTLQVSLVDRIIPQLFEFHDWGFHLKL